MATEERSMIMGCAALRVIQQTAKVADVSEDLRDLLKELNEAAIDAGGPMSATGRQLRDLQENVMKMQVALGNALHYIAIKPLVDQLSTTSYSALEEVIGNIRSAVREPSQLSPWVLYAEHGKADVAAARKAVSA